MTDQQTPAPQPDLFTEPVYFDGETYDPALDKHRLTKQLGRVYECLSNGEWWTLEELQRRCSEMRESGEDSIQGISARLRDLRKDRFGKHQVDRARVGGGLWRYRMLRNSR